MDLSRKHHSNDVKVNRMVEPRKTPKKKEHTKEEELALTKPVEDKFSEKPLIAGHNDHVLRGCIHGKKNTVWDRNFGVFWATVASMEMSPFDLLMQTAENFVCVPPKALEHNLWRVPLCRSFRRTWNQDFRRHAT